MLRISFGPVDDLRYRTFTGPLMAIAFHDRDRRPPEALSCRTIDAVLLVAADDEEAGPGALTEAQAASVAAFAEVANDTDTELYVCCEGGVGRSAACMAAILWATRDRHLAYDAVFSRGDLAPNRHVFDLVRQALLGEADQEEQALVDDMFARQQEAFERLHSDD